MRSAKLHMCFLASSLPFLSIILACALDHMSNSLIRFLNINLAQLKVLLCPLHHGNDILVVEITYFIPLINHLDKIKEYDIIQHLQFSKIPLFYIDIQIKDESSSRCSLLWVCLLTFLPSIPWS